MSPQHMPNALREQCLRCVQQVLTNHNWQLAQDEDVFVEEVEVEVRNRLDKMRGKSLEHVIRDATFNRYSHMLYAACCAEVTWRRERAFTELHAYLYGIALHRAGFDEHVATECAQEAIINLWRTLDKVRDAGAFIRYAQVAVIRLVWKKLTKEAQRVTAQEGDTPAQRLKEFSMSDLRYLSADDTPPQQEPILTGHVRVKLEKAIRNCLRNRKQQEAIIQCFLNNKPHSEAAAELEITPQTLSVLKSKALARLRGCREFINVLEDLL